MLVGMKRVDQVTALSHGDGSKGAAWSAELRSAFHHRFDRFAQFTPFRSAERLLQFIKFCMVGGSGVFVDMGILYLLADPRTLAWNVTLSKICAAEVAMINNFIWNEFWTFRPSTLNSQRSALNPQPSTDAAPSFTALLYLMRFAASGLASPCSCFIPFAPGSAEISTCPTS